jgi:hypothetical protein
LDTIPEPLILPPITTNQTSDNSAHNNLDEQTLPSQVLVHSPTSNQRAIGFREPMTRTFISSFDSPVRIRPTRYQINDATSLITFSDISGINQTRCPIDLIDFGPDDNIMKIDHCGHIFRETNIRMHFRDNTRCPLCRFDIRDHGITDSIA